MCASDWGSWSQRGALSREWKLEGSREGWPISLLLGREAEIGGRENMVGLGASTGGMAGEGGRQKRQFRRKAQGPLVGSEVGLLAALLEALTPPIMQRRSRKRPGARKGKLGRAKSRSDRQLADAGATKEEVPGRPAQPRGRRGRG